MERGIPALVVFPGNTQEVADLVALANKEGYAIFPRGAGTGLSSGSVPHEEGIALVLTRFNKIKEIRKEDMLAVVEPGVVTEYFHKAVEKEGLPRMLQNVICFGKPGGLFPLLLYN